MSVAEAVGRDLEKMPVELRESAFAASALALAREMDSDSSATSKSMCARALLETLDRLRELSAEAAGREANPLDEIRARREERIAAQRGSKAKARARSRGGGSS